MLLYDADCGFCTRSAHGLQRLRLRAEIRPYQSVDLAAAGVSPARAVQEIPFVADDGQVSYGPAGIAGALRTGAWPLRLVGGALTSRALDGVAQAGYRWIAAHRYQLPGGTAACKIDTTAD